MPDHNQLRMARMALEKSLAEVAAAVDVGRSTLTLLESGGGARPDLDLVAKLTAHYEALGVQFGPDGQVTLTPRLRYPGARSIH